MSTAKIAKNGRKNEVIKIKNGYIVTIRKENKADASAILEYINMIGGESDFLIFAEGKFGISIEACLI